MCTDVVKNNAWNILVLLQECVWNPYLGYKEKVETLKRKMNELISRKKDITDKIEYDERHSSKPRKTEVITWLQSVERLVHEFERFEQKVQQTYRYSPSRICLSKRADKIQKEMEDLREQSAFPEGYFLDENEKELPLVTTNMKGQLFEQNLREVLVSLNKVSSIGIYGMGGVGKTTLATHIHDHLLKDSRFSGNVYWITVSQDFSITKLQDGIAKMLNLDLSTEDDERKRTSKLSHSLKRKESFVLILDDVWNHFDVEKVGIPLETSGGKLIITSRSVEVCDGIGCKNKVNVGTLSRTESWELFLEKLDYHGDLPKEIEEIAKKMTKKCDGLPLGLITVAASMRGVTDVFEWSDAFEDFKESCTQVEYMNENVFPILQYSYNRLRDERLKKCFLYCCLYPEDEEIERVELIRLFIVEGFLDSRKSRKAEFDQGHVVLNKLERACLLEGAVNEDEHRCVRMHDLVREMALKIGRDKSKWMVKAGAQLHEIPGEQEWREDLDKVSLMDNDIREISQPLSYELPMLTTLILRRNHNLSVVVDPFFVQMQALRVLDLSNTEIEKLPSSVSNLKCLSALLLQHCRQLRYVPPLNNLTNLIELDLFDTETEEVPQGLEYLVNLKYLNMRTRVRIEKPAEDILARLSNLQVLSIPFVVRVKYLEGMRNLDRFHGVFDDISSFNRFVKYRQSFDKPGSFAITLASKQSSGTVDNYTGNQVVLEDIALTGDNVEMLHHDQIEEGRDVTLLPLDTQVLVILSCNFGTLGNSLLDAIPSLIQSTHLRIIDIVQCNGIEFLIRVGKFVPPVGTFSHLEKLRFTECDNLKKLIPRWLLQYLQNLTEIVVSDCKEMEEIITEDEEEQFNQWASSASSSSSILPSNQSRSINDDEVVLPKLEVLHLLVLPKLKSIYKGRLTCSSIERIIIGQCPQLKRIPFTLPLQDGKPSAPPALKDILINKESWESLEFDHSQHKNVLHPFVRYVNF